MDFTLAPLLVLEETVCPSIAISVCGFELIVPAAWNLLVCATETHQLDVVPMYDLAGREFTAMVYGPNVPYVQTEKVKVVDYYPNYLNTAPSFNNHQMLCHPISPDRWITMTPTDVYNKFLKNKTSGDIVD